MPSALRSGGGSLLSSVPGGALGEPLSATYSVFPSGLALMPRGRFPSGAVAMTACVDASMTVRSPDASFVTYTRTFGGAGGAGATGAAGGFGASDFGASWPQAAAAIAAAMTRTRVRVFISRMIPHDLHEVLGGCASTGDFAVGCWEASPVGCWEASPVGCWQASPVGCWEAWPLGCSMIPVFGAVCASDPSRSRQAAGFFRRRAR